MGRDKIRLGLFGQQIGERYLRRLGYQIIERNYYCRWGEIDLVALEGESLIFIEVRTRSSDQTLKPLESITPKKLVSLKRAARYYLHTHPELPRLWRVDCLGITLDRERGILVDLRRNCLE